MRILPNLGFIKSGAFQALTLAALCVAAYAPALDNGFISDDFVNLQLAEAVRNDFWHLFQLPPLNFRMTSFIAYGMLRDAFGDNSGFYYAANIFLHFLNCLLLWKLIVLLGRGRDEAYLAAALFAVFQAPQEAVMWIAAMKETLMGTFVLLTLVFWFKGRYFVSACFYLLALFSKESAPLVILLILLIHWFRRERMFTVQLALLLLPTLVFAAAFAWTQSIDSQYDAYEIGPHALPVLARSLHLLLRPSFYVLVLALMATSRRREYLALLPKFVFWIAVPILPYIFLTYSPYVPSRHVYIASMVLTAVMAYLLLQLGSRTLRRALVLAFLFYNVGYLWLKIDPEFERRAAPTAHLLALLKSHEPAPVEVDGFPYDEEIARAVAGLAPGWSPDLIHVNRGAEPCAGCVILRWDSKAQSYTGEW